MNGGAPPGEKRGQLCICGGRESLQSFRAERVSTTGALLLSECQTDQRCEDVDSAPGALSWNFMMQSSTPKKEACDQVLLVGGLSWSQ